MAQKILYANVSVMLTKVTLGQDVECKVDVLLRREIYQKVICEKVKFSNCDFCNNFYNYEYIENYLYILIDFRSRAIGDKFYFKTTTSKSFYTISVEGLKKHVLN